MRWTRIAPTPSGYLHVGNALSFLVTAGLARSLGAHLRLRIDDLDAERGRAAFVDDIFASLSWLGISWEAGPRDRHDYERHWSQAARVPRYIEAIGLLKEQGDLYACTCSRKTLTDLQRRGSRHCECRAKRLSLHAADAAWRLHIPADAVVRMERLFSGAQVLVPADLMTDPVIRQRTSLEGGGRPAYQIASLIDDVDHGTTFIVRGEDLLPSTACQLYLADRLGLEAFKSVRFVHHPLVTDAEGRKLSKSEGAGALRTMRMNGGLPDELHTRAKDMLASVIEGQERART